MKRKRILVLESYFGGSHKQFLNGLMVNVEVDYCLLQLPARKWKMRMQLSAPWFVKKIKEMVPEKRIFDSVLISTFTDAAVFLALTRKIENWNKDAKLYTYFHENQFQYPDSKPKTANHQFTAINFTTALVSDSIGFNSSYNMNGFIEQCKKYIKKAADMDLEGEIEKIGEKSRIIFPGIDFDEIDLMRKQKKRNQIPLIIWNHRWEHDKNPKDFFNGCYRLKNEGVPFRLAVLGQKFSHIPVCFRKAEKELQNNIVHFGYIEDKKEYYQMLLEGDYVVSTAVHEFFGISVIEAVRAGCYPILPDRLSYPELFDKSFLYQENKFYPFLKRKISTHADITENESIKMTESFSWKNLKSDYKSWLS